MTKDQKARLVKIHKLLDAARGGDGTIVVVDVSDTSHLISAVTEILADKEFQQLLSNTNRQIRLNSNVDLYAVAHAYLQMFLLKGDYESAATLIWSENQFTCEPYSVKLVWKGLRENRLINCLGAASMGKTFSAGAYFLLDYAADPDYTMVRIMSTKEQHVRDNLFAGIQRLWACSAIPLPGVSEAECIATENGKKFGMGIRPFTIARGANAPPAIKGTKMATRPTPHPVYGRLARVRFLIDEGQEVPENVFTKEIPNLYSSFKEGDVQGIKVFVAANPSDEFSTFGKNCKKEKDWDKIQQKMSPIDEWDSDRGWHCVRLNGLKSENLIHKKEIYEGFLTVTGYETKLKQYSFDVDAAGMWSEIYGFFPPKGNVSTIIQKHWVSRSYGEWIFDGQTIGLAGMDVAFTGDLPVLATGRAGLAVAWLDFMGERHDLPEPAWKLQIDMVGVLPRGDTQDLADEAMSRLKILGIKPMHFAIDRTGNGQGTHDTIRRQWKQKVDGVDPRMTLSIPPVDIIGVMFAESATTMKIALEDTKTPKELYQGIASELWYGTSRYFEYDVLRLGRGVDPAAVDELVSRQGGPQSGRSKLYAVETKEIYKQRGHPSPDKADAITLLVFAARMTVSELVPKAPDTKIDVVIEPNALDEMKSQREGFMKTEAAFDLGDFDFFGQGHDGKINWGED